MAHAGLTDTEMRVLDHLGEAWNEFLLLPVEHPDHMREFRDAVHRLQDLIGARATWRALYAVPHPAKEDRA